MITQDISQITPLPSFLAPERPAAVDNLVEVELPLLTEELQAAINQVNSTEQSINNKEASVSDKYNSLSPYFDEIDLVAAAIQGGDLPTIIDDADTSVLKTWSSEKIDSEIDIHNKTEKILPVDTDEIMIADSALSFSFKKLTWANIKSKLKDYFDSFYMALTGNQTVAGNKNFTGNLLMTGSSSVIGYGTGSGGSVTQLTSKSTTVTLNKPTGRITTNNEALISNAGVVFSFNNNLLNAGDNILIGCDSVGYRVFADAVGVGGCTILLENRTAGTLNDAVVLNYQIIKGA